MSPLEKMARAIEEASHRAAYSMELIELIDGDHTYRLQIDGQTLTFKDSETDDWNAQERLYEKLREIKNTMTARAALLAIREPDEAMIEAGWYAELPGGQYGEPGFRESTVDDLDVPVIWREMIDAILNQEPRP